MTIGKKEKIFIDSIHIKWVRRMSHKTRMCVFSADDESNFARQMIESIQDENSKLKEKILKIKTENSELINRNESLQVLISTNPH